MDYPMQPSLRANPGKTLALTLDNVYQTLNNDLPVLLDFWAPWCQPCRALEPTIEKLNVQYADYLTLAKVNVDLQNELSKRFNVRSIPTLILVKNGEELLRLGADEYTYEQLIKELEPHL